METKTCTKCGAEKPATFEFFYHRKSAPDGLRADCRECCKQRNKAWADANPERRKAITRRASEDWRNRGNNRETCRAKWRERYHSDPEFRAYDIRRRIANAEKDVDKARADHRAWYARHRDDLCRVRRARWKADPDRYRLKGRRRRARKAAAAGSHTAADVSAQYKRQHGRCYYCGERVGDHYHVDHVVPLARGGGDGPDNIVISCPACNLRKNTKLPHEFSGRLC